MLIDSRFLIAFQGIDVNLQHPEPFISRVGTISEWFKTRKRENSSNLRSRDNQTVEVVPYPNFATT
jgi:hypothetical protein